MSTSARSTKRTGGRATGPRQSRGGGAAGRSLSPNTADGVVAIGLWVALAAAGVYFLVGPAQAVTVAAWNRTAQWVMHDIRDPDLGDIPVRAERPAKGYSPASFGKGTRPSPVLAEAWRSGAASWTPAQREAFANDPDELLLVKASENRSKGDAAQWQPATSASGCLYAQRVVAIKYHWRLSVDARERDALERDLAGC